MLGTFSVPVIAGKSSPFDDRRRLSWDERQHWADQLVAWALGPMTEPEPEPAAPAEPEKTTALPDPLAPQMARRFRGWRIVLSGLRR